MDQIYDVYWINQPLVLDLVIQKDGTQPPAGYTALGVFTHPGDADELGYAGSHVLFHHLQELLYKKGRTDMSNLKAKLDLTAPPASTPVTGVTVAPATLTLAPGGTRQLTITIAPPDASNQSTTCASSNPSVATVSNAGLITAVAAGTADITVTTVDGGFTKITKLTVKVAVTSVAIAGLSGNILASWGPWENLTATVLPANATNKDVTWATSAPTVMAHEGNGQFSPQAVGTSTITCTSVDDPTKKATQVVTVKTAAPDSISTSPAGTSPAVIGANLRVTAYYFPEDPIAVGITAVSSDPAVATVSAGVPGKEGNRPIMTFTVTPLTAGPVKITFTHETSTVPPVELDVTVS